MGKCGNNSDLPTYLREFVSRDAAPGGSSDLLLASGKFRHRGWGLRSWHEIGWMVREVVYGTLRKRRASGAVADDVEVGRGLERRKMSMFVLKHG